MRRHQITTGNRGRRNAGSKCSNSDWSSALRAFWRCGPDRKSSRCARWVVQTLTNGGVNQQSLFSAAYFVVTLIIGFVAGLLAGLIAFETITQALTVKVALAAMAAGYAGADFIENTYSALGGAFGVGAGTGQRQGGGPNQGQVGGGGGQGPEAGQGQGGEGGGQGHGAATRGAAGQPTAAGAQLVAPNGVPRARSAERRGRKAFPIRDDRRAGAAVRPREPQQFGRGSDGRHGLQNVSGDAASANRPQFALCPRRPPVARTDGQGNGLCRACNDPG